MTSRLIMQIAAAIIPVLIIMAVGPAASSGAVNDKAELIINSEDILVSPGNPLNNETVTITAIVKNMGTLNTDNVTIKILIDNNLTVCKILNISLNSSETFVFNWTGILGEHNITVIIDPENAVDEDNESNNNATIQIIVRECVIPGGDFYVNEDILLCEGIYNDTEIIVNKSGVVVDCNGAVLDGNRFPIGIYNNGQDNVTIKNCHLVNYVTGLLIDNVFNNAIINNNISSNGWGIKTHSVKNTSITGNVLTSNNLTGIGIYNSDNNKISNNTFYSNCNHIDFNSRMY